MGAKIRIFCLLVVFGIALFALKPVGEVRKAELMRNTHVIRLQKLRVSRNKTQKLHRVADLEVTNKVFDDVPVRIYRPRDGNKKIHNSLPAVVYFHGGGWIKRSVDDYDLYTRKIAVNLKLLVVSVEYRLAPQYPYPIPLDDCYKATLYVMNHAAELGIDASKVMLMGDSAGGNLAAVVSHRMKGIEPPLLAQILIYPVTQSLNLQLPSFKLRNASAEWMSRYFLPYFTGSLNASLLFSMVRGAYVSDRVHKQLAKYVDYRKLPASFRKGHVPLPRVKADPSAARALEPFITDPNINPLIREDLSGLPQAMVLTAGQDALRDDGTLYALRLKDAGVPVRHLYYEKGRHGSCCSGNDTEPGSVSFVMDSDIFHFIHSLVSNT